MMGQVEGRRELAVLQSVFKKSFLACWRGKTEQFLIPKNQGIERVFVVSGRGFGRSLA
jgi:hypothetical protein